MITEKEKKSLLQVIGYDRDLPATYSFLESTLKKDSGYKESDRQLSERLIKYLDSLDEDSRKEFVKEARKLTRM